jgi:death-on-curing protein
VTREPQWLDKRALLLLHEESVATFGGASGPRDDGLLDSALGRAPHQWHYDKAVDLADLAAAYGYGLAKNQAFVDGSQRVAFPAIDLFLAINGKLLRADQAVAIHTILDLAAGGLSETELAHRIRARIA